MIWEPGRRRCSAAAMKDSMAAICALMLFLLPTAPVSAAKYASALTEPAQTQCHVAALSPDVHCLPSVLFHCSSHGLATCFTALKAFKVDIRRLGR